jgi:hypothetical protein
VGRWLERNGYGKRKGVAVLGGGEGSGPLYPPPVIDEDMFTADIAAELGTLIQLLIFRFALLFASVWRVSVCVCWSANCLHSTAFNEAQIGPNDIDFFGLYDCFPICFIRAIEAVGLAKKGTPLAWWCARCVSLKTHDLRRRFLVVVMVVMVMM